jgi:hypothetical protein
MMGWAYKRGTSTTRYALMCLFLRNAVYCTALRTPVALFDKKELHVEFYELQKPYSPFMRPKY